MNDVYLVFVPLQQGTKTHTFAPIEPFGSRSGFLVLLSLHLLECDICATGRISACTLEAIFPSPPNALLDGSLNQLLLQFQDYPNILYIKHRKKIKCWHVRLLSGFWRHVCLETVQDNILGMTNFLIHQKVLDIGSLITRKLNDFPNLFIFLDGTVAGKVLLEGLANSFNVQIISQSSHGRNTFSSVTLLDTHVNLFFGRISSLVSGVLKGV